MSDETKPYTPDPTQDEERAYGGDSLVVIEPGHYILNGEERYDWDEFLSHHPELTGGTTDEAQRLSASWFVNEGLRVLISQVKARNSGMTVGTIGDATHSAKESDHNPNGRRSVCAADFMIHGAFSWADAVALKDALFKANDGRIKYVIFNRRIWNPSISHTWRAYSGSDPHTNHVHVSVDDSRSTKAWNLGAAPAVVKNRRGIAYPGLVKSGTKGTAAKAWQTEINYDLKTKLTLDGDFGSASVAALKKLQKKHGVSADGEGGPATWKVSL